MNVDLDPAAGLRMVATCAWFTYEDVTIALGCSRRTAIRYVKAGRIPSPAYFGELARWPEKDFASVRLGPQRARTYAYLPSPQDIRRKAAKRPARKNPKGKKARGR